MSWPRAYRAALHLLPGELRRKHGSAMVTLFARECERARARGRLHGALAGAAGVWDVVRRAAYEQVRPGPAAAGASGDHAPWYRWRVDAPGPQPAGADVGGPRMSRLTTTRQLLRRHAASFAISFAALTTVLLAHFATRRVPGLSTRGAPAGTVAEMLLLALPFIAAMTIPMAILVTVLHEFTRLRTDGTLAAARRERGGVRRLVLPVLAAAVGVAALTLVSNTELLPRANARLATVLAGRTEAPTDRTMTIGELRAAARVARADAGPRARSTAAVYEVEVQKKYALATACVVLALAGVAIALRVPRGGVGLVIGASAMVVGAYYVLLVTGEQLAERLVVSPFVAMWGANAVLLAAASLALWRRRPASGSGGRRTVVLRG